MLSAKNDNETLTICYSIFASRLDGKREINKTLLVIEKLCTALFVLFDLAMTKLLQKPELVDKGMVCVCNTGYSPDGE
jgi:hypothetical protein